MANIFHFDRLCAHTVHVDEDGYVVMPFNTLRRYEQLFKRYGIDVNAALDTLEAFESAVARCGLGAKVYCLERA